MQIFKNSPFYVIRRIRQGPRIEWDVEIGSWKIEQFLKR